MRRVLLRRHAGGFGVWWRLWRVVAPLLHDARIIVKEHHTALCVDAMRGRLGSVFGRHLRGGAWSHRRSSLRQCVMCHQEVAFVEEDANVAKWKVAHAKIRENDGASAPVSRGRRR